MHGKLNLSVGALTERYAFKLELIEFHIGEHLLVLVLTRHPQLARLDEGCRLLNSSNFGRVKS